MCRVGPVEDFFATVHALRCGADNTKDIVFAAQPSATFPSSDARLDVIDSSGNHPLGENIRYVLTSALGVLTGLLGPLPEYLAYATLAEETPAMQVLLSVAHNQLISAWVDSTLSNTPRYHWRSYRRSAWQQRLWGLGHTVESSDNRVSEAGWPVRASGKTTAKMLVARLSQILTAFGCEPLSLQFVPLQGGRIFLQRQDRSVLGRINLGRNFLLGSCMMAPHTAFCVIADVGSRQQWVHLRDTPGIDEALNEAFEQLVPRTQSFRLIWRLAPDTLPAWSLSAGRCMSVRLGQDAFLARQPRHAHVTWLKPSTEIERNRVHGTAD